MSSLEPSRIPAWLAPVCDDRSVSHSCEPVAVVGDPARHRRCVAVAHGAPEHGQRQPVDLEVDDAGDVGALRGAEPARDAPGHAQVVLVVVVGPGDHLQRRADGGDDQRGQQRVAEPGDAQPLRERVGDQHQQEGVHEEHQQEADGDHERQPQCGEQGRDHGVQEREAERDHAARSGLLQVDAGQDPGRGVHRRGQQRPGDEQPQQAELGPGRLPANQLFVGHRRIFAPPPPPCHRPMRMMRQARRRAGRDRGRR